MDDEQNEPIQPRATPCASCPYRRNVPSGIWDVEEYQKLPRYDVDLPEQPRAVFFCHLDEGCACAGWLGHRNPAIYSLSASACCRGASIPHA